MTAHVPLTEDRQFFQRLSCWFLDLDDTLVVSSFDEAIYPAILDTQRALGRTTDISLELARTFWYQEGRLPMMVEHFGWPADEPEVHFWEAFRQHENVDRRVAHTVFLPGALETVTRLLSEGKHVHVVTATGVAMADAELGLFRQQGINLPFTALGDINPPFPQKPDPAVIKRRLHEYQVRPHRAVIVGDHKRDIQMGNAAGIHSVYLDAVDRHCPEAAASCTAHFEAWEDVPLQ
jgi:phosphoglycolate phosphatase-like HAD superfamily hydrolase